MSPQRELAILASKSFTTTEFLGSPKRWQWKKREWWKWSLRCPGWKEELWKKSRWSINVNVWFSFVFDWYHQSRFNSKVVWTVSLTCPAKLVCLFSLFLYLFNSPTQSPAHHTQSWCTLPAHSSSSYPILTLDNHAATTTMGCSPSLGKCASSSKHSRKTDIDPVGSIILALLH